MGWIAIDPFEVAGKAGTMSMQALMLAAIVILGAVIVWQNKVNDKRQLNQHEENKASNRQLFEKLESTERSIGEERKTRISSLMDMIREDTTAKEKISNAIINNTKALDHNSEITASLKELIQDRLPKIKI